MFYSTAFFFFIFIKHNYVIYAKDINIVIIM